MKSIINRKNKQENTNSDELRKTAEIQRKLQNLENNIARNMGFSPRNVVYAPYDKNFNREAIIDYLIENYYPLNIETGLSVDEFRAVIINQMSSIIEQQVDSEEKYASGFFKKQYPDRVFLFSNTIKHNEYLAENILIHESLHAGFFDLISNKIDSLKIYKNKRYDDEFFLNLLKEHQMKPLLSNKNGEVLKSIGMPDKIYQYYSFDEDIVMYNTLCTILEKELKSNKVDMEKIIYSFVLYCGSAGMEVKPILDYKSIKLYGQIIPLKDYLPTYLSILRGPISGYSEEDKKLSGVIKPLDYDKIHFEEIKSEIPELVESILVQIKNNKYSKELIRSKINEYLAQHKTLI